MIEALVVSHITFDNKEVGRMQARAVWAAKPKDNCVMIKNAPTDANVDFSQIGQQQALDGATAVV